MANVINYKNFNVNNIKLSVEHKKYLYSNDTYHFKKIMPKYVYEDGIEEDMYIQLPEGLSYGIKTFDNTKTKNDNKAPPSHSFSLAIDALVNNDIDEKVKIIKMFEQIQERVKAFLYEENVMKKLGRLSDETKLRNMEWSEEKIMTKLDKEKVNWATAIDGIKSFLSYQIDKETNEKNEASGPTLFMKLKTDKSKTDKSNNPLIKTVFRQINSNNEIEEIPQTSLPELFQGVRCIAIGVVHIESIYIPKLNNISIQFNIHEVLITKIIQKDKSRIQLPENYLGLLNNKVDKIFDSDDDDEIVHSNSSSNKSSNEVKPIKKIIRRFPTKENDDESSNDEKHVDVDDSVKPKPIIKKVIRRPPPTKENDDESSNDEKHVDVDDSVKPKPKPKPIIKKVINKRSPTKENN